MAESSSSVNAIETDDFHVSDGAKVFTMVDVLEEEQELEDCTKALLGASDDKNCTYSKGYVKRQPLYACITCTPQWTENSQPGGVCLACSYHCHEGHELIELYTKRNFRCDCGNTKFPEHKCNLEPNKSSINELNQYNHNFHGVYCTCKKPYPDPDDDSNDTMIQCIVCEDWYHEKHLGKSGPLQTDSGELICGLCMKKNDFLCIYAEIADPWVAEEGCVLAKVNCAAPCEGLQAPTKKVEATVFPEGWRKNLCRCENCLHIYNNKGLNFLPDELDTVQAYVEKGEACGESQYERGMKALSSMDRVQIIDAIEGFNDMKTQLMEYLQKFAENKKVVREEDIREFFSGMEARKRQRVVPQAP